MADITGGEGGLSGPAFLISATFVYTVIAKACSSPQTAEINADKRAETLMKWVNIGTIESAGIVAIAWYIDKPHRTEILLGGILAGAITYGQYVYAKWSGLKNGGPGTES